MVSSDVNGLACTYASLILYDDGKPANADNLAKLVKAAKVNVDPFFTTMYAKAFGSLNVEELLDSVSNVSAGAPAAAGAAPAAAAGGDKPAAAAKAKEPEPEEEADMGFSLFD